MTNPPVQFKGKTDAKGVAPGDQLDVYERVVNWSAVKQLRSVVETELACDDIFEFIAKTLQTDKTAKKMKKLAASNAREAEVFNGTRVTVFFSREENCATQIFYQEVPLPWPFEPRYFCVLQDYVRIDGTSLFTYNHDVDTEYFAKQDGFQRVKVKFQGLVALPSAQKGVTRLR